MLAEVTSSIIPTMIKKKSTTMAFTLIELLVVITIIGILASIALPVFNTVQVKGAQTKALAQAKQVGLALKLFAGDNDGIFPKTGTPTGNTGTNSNDNYAALFPTYTQSETIFANKRCAYNTVVPDNKITSPYDGANRGSTLTAGENAYAYMMGLTDSSNANYPIVMDAPASAANPTYPLGGAAVRGSVWDGAKAIMVFTDNSAQLMTVNSADHYVRRTDSAAGTPNILVPVAAAGNDPGWCSGCTLTVPN